MFFFPQLSDCGISSLRASIGFVSPFPLTLGQCVLANPPFIRPLLQDLQEQAVLLEVWFESGCHNQSWEQLPSLALEFVVV